MNSNWRNLILSQQDHFETPSVESLRQLSSKNIFPLLHLGILKISGPDAATFLQGQLTCNVFELNATHAFFAALCNPKGRAIASFFILKKADDFLMILPLELLATIQQRLQKYKLRAKVDLSDSSDSLTLIGLSESNTSLKPRFSVTQEPILRLHIDTRQLLIVNTEQTPALWQDFIQKGFHATHSDYWRYLDIVSGLPWLTEKTTEAFIPQMLSLDKLGGISFNKGCYTGQEIIARTHYLGKTKRALFVAESDTPLTPQANAELIADYCKNTANTDDNEPCTGRVLLAQRVDNHCSLLVVIPVTDNGEYSLKLANQHKVTVLNSVS